MLKIKTKTNLKLLSFKTILTMIKPIDEKKQNAKKKDLAFII